MGIRLVVDLIIFHILDSKIQKGLWFDLSYESVQMNVFYKRTKHFSYFGYQSFSEDRRNFIFLLKTAIDNANTSLTVC